MPSTPAQHKLTYNRRRERGLSANCAAYKHDECSMCKCEDCHARVRVAVMAERVRCQARSTSECIDLMLDCTTKNGCLYRRK